MVEHGSDVNQVGGGGDYPLQILIHGSGDSGISRDRSKAAVAAIVEFLLDNGADPTVRRSSMNRERYRLSGLQEAVDRWASVFQMMLSKSNDDLIKKECWFAFDPATLDLPTFLEIFQTAGIGINTADPADGKTLYLRELGGHWDTLRTLKEYGARSDVVDKAGNGTMHLLVALGLNLGRSGLENNKLQRLWRLVDEEHLDPRLTNNNALLHMAASVYEPGQSETDLVRWLVSLGIPADSVNRDGHTAQQILMTRTRDIARLSELARAISDATKETDSSWIEIKNKDGLNPLHMAVMRSDREATSLTGNGHMQNVLHLASRARKPNMVGQIMHQATALSLLAELINQAEGLGKMALHYASATGEPESVSFLLENGADVKMLDANACSVLHACADFRAEQTIWDANGQGGLDAFRPLTKEEPPSGDPFDHDKVDGSAWYLQPGRGKIPRPCKTFFHSVCIIAKMLLDTGADPSSVNKPLKDSRRWIMLST